MCIKCIYIYYHIIYDNIIYDNIIIDAATANTATDLMYFFDNKIFISLARQHRNVSS